MSSRRKLITVSGSVVLLSILSGCATREAPAPADRPAGIDNYLQGVAAIETGDRDRAVASLESAVRSNPGLIMARQRLGELYLDDREYESAVTHYQQLTRLDEYTASHHYNLGFANHMLSRFREATVAYIRAVELLPGDFASNMNLGLAYYSLRELDAAEFYLERASRIEPDNPRVWSNLGVVHDARGNAILAEASYRRSLELDGENLATLTNLTDNLIAQRRASDAVGTATTLTQRDADAEHLRRLGDALTLQRSWDDALAAYDRAIARDPGNPRLYNAKAQSLITRFDADLGLDDSLRNRAVAEWEKSLKLKADQPEVVALLEKWRKRSR